MIESEGGSELTTNATLARAGSDERAMEGQAEADGFIGSFNGRLRNGVAQGNTVLFTHPSRASQMPINLVSIYAFKTLRGLVNYPCAEPSVDASEVRRYSSTASRNARASAC